MEMLGVVLKLSLRSLAILSFNSLSSFYRLDISIREHLHCLIHFFIIRGHNISHFLLFSQIFIFLFSDGMIRQHVHAGDTFQRSCEIQPFAVMFSWSSFMQGYKGEAKV